MPVGTKGKDGGIAHPDEDQHDEDGREMVADTLHDLCFFIFWYNDCDDFLFFLDRDAEDDSRFSGTAAQTF